jgi:PIN domain nuclease of toxin-antitoxin system
MDLLLDTHAFLWWADGALSGPALAAVSDPGNRVFVSAACVWEISIKAAKGKLEFEGSPVDAIRESGFLPLAIDPEDAEVAGGLAWDHADPFDRMHVAQAVRRRLILVHADAAIERSGLVASLPAR